MTIIKILLSGVNEVAEKDRKEYESFLAGLLSLHCAAAKNFKIEIDVYIADVFGEMTKDDMMGVIMASGIKPRAGETLSAFDDRVRAWPMFRQLPLLDYEAEFI